jgi:hypothetical protein
MTDKLGSILTEADNLLEIVGSIDRASLPRHAERIRSIALRLRELYTELDAERRRVEADACCYEECTR